MNVGSCTLKSRRHAANFFKSFSSVFFSFSNSCCSLFVNRPAAGSYHTLAGFLRLSASIIVNLRAYTSWTPKNTTLITDK